jgi:hypothetical protein
MGIDRVLRNRSTRSEALECVQLAGWGLSLYICDEMNDERRETVEYESHCPRPLWGRGWTATRAFISGGGHGAPRSACRGGEGVKADFCCAEVRLIVELGGRVRGQPSQARSDARRDAPLKTLGFTVLRLPNGIVLQAPELFVQKVVSFVLLTEAVG